MAIDKDSNMDFESRIEAEDLGFPVGDYESLDDPRLYINREISWLKFNQRVLEEAMDARHPLLERIKFLAICGSNLDEFFMVRASGLQRQVNRGALETPPDGMTPLQQLYAIRKEMLPLLKGHSRCWRNELIPALAEAGIEIKRVEDLEESKQEALRSYFKRQVFPTLTPIALDLTHAFPFISNLSLNLAVVMEDPSGNEKYARLKVPRTLFPRFVRVPDDKDSDRTKKSGMFDRQVEMVLLEDLVTSNLDLLFPGMEITAAYPFKVTRDAKIEITLDEAPDLLTAVEESVNTRRVGFPSRLEVDKSMPKRLVELFRRRMDMPQSMVFRFNGPLGLADLWGLRGLDRPDLKDAPFLPHTPRELGGDRDILGEIRQRDYLLYHPYDSFNIIINMLHQSARDPNVLAIKITLYRIDENSPVIDALLEARENGKAVAVIVELKAKFDEQNNIEWARRLEEAGVHVVYGLVDLKVHAKLLMIVRREAEDIVRYCHLSSGNYNAVTSRIYGDIGYLTCNPDFGNDVSDLFNFLTGYSDKKDYSTLLVAPVTLKREIIRRIEREIDLHRESGDGYIALKANGLLDTDVIKALYRASMVGIKVDLNIRGLCSLRPGIEGISDNIGEISIVGRFLEHARIYYFRNGGNGNEEVILGSSDLMPRNVRKRVETLFPVPDPEIREALIKCILNIHLADNEKARRLLPDGKYEPVTPKKNEPVINSQEWLIEHRKIWHERHPEE
jgi:polyphosphate kinase